MPDDDPIPELSPTPNTPLPTQPLPALSDEALGQWFQSLWPDDLEILCSFQKKSWGTAYKAIAEVQVLVRIGRRSGMEINLATHSVSPGTYLDGDNQWKSIAFTALGWHLNGQAEGMWTNKLTFFFAVYNFLCETESATEETLGNELWEAREAMLTWGVLLRPPTSFLDIGDRNARHNKTRLHAMIKKYMVS